MAIDLTRLFTTLGRDVGTMNLLAARDGDDYGTAVSALQSHAAAEVVNAVAEDQGVVYDTDAALTQVSFALTAATETVSWKNGTLTLAAVGSPAGTPRFVTTDLTQFGTRSNFLTPEVIRLRATSADALSLVGEEATDKTAAAWPTGSGTNGTLTLIDPSADGGLLTNGNFASWSGTPLAADGWAIVSGSDVWGTDFSRVADEPFSSGGFSLKVLADGAIKQVRQQVDVSVPGVYALQFFARKVVFAGATGSVVITLRDAAGNALSGTTVTNTFTSLGSTWGSYGGVLYVPRQLAEGAEAYLEIRWTGTSGDVLHIGDISLQPMTPLYAGGPSIVGFRGVTQLSLDTDAWTLTVAVSGPTSSLIVGIDRLVGLAGKGFEFPAASSGTYGDSLVV